MKYEITNEGNPTEALGAHSGYRIRLIAQRDGPAGKYVVCAFFRGSESLPENPVSIVGGAAFDTVAQALDFGYSRCVEWIDGMDAHEAEEWG